MTTERAQLEGLVETLRKKQLLATIIAALVEALLVAALLYALLRLGLPNLVLSKPKRLAAVAFVLIAFAIALLFEQQRQARSTLYWAKRIDDTNAFDDHLTAALAMPDPVTSGFEAMVVRSLLVRLQSVQVRFPDVRLERVWLLAPAAVIAIGTGLVDLRRKQRPHDDGRSVVVIGDNVRDLANALEHNEAVQRADARLAKQAEDARHAFADLVGKRLDKETVLARVSAQSQELDAFDRERASVMDAALQLGTPGSQRAQSLLSAVQSGQAASLNQALDTLEKAVSGQIPPPLSPEERGEIEGVLRELAKASTDAALADKLNQAADAVADPARNKEAAAALAQLRGPLGEQLTREQATRQLERSLRGLLAETRREAEHQAGAPLVGSGNGPQEARPDAGNVAGAAAGDRVAAETRNPDDEGPLNDSDTTPESGSSRGSATAANLGGGTPESPTTARDERVSSPWVGAPVKQLVAATASGNKDAQEATRVQLGAQRRTAESEVRREEIPPEYAQFIQRYFFNLQQESERQWKPSK